MGKRQPHGDDVFARWYVKAGDAIKAAEMVHDLEPRVGRCNRKTMMVNEGTTPGACGSCDASCIKDCHDLCYAIWHIDNVYPTCLRNHAENLVFRRRDPVGYYLAFFCEAANRNMALRVNETGDFETAGDVLALDMVARMFPSVKVVGYSKRFRLLPAISRLNKLPNVTIHFSLACDGRYETLARKAGVPCTRITFDPKECSCPNQRFKAAGVVKPWYCATCAAKKCGCFSDRDVVFLAH